MFRTGIDVYAGAVLTGVRIRGVKQQRVGFFQSFQLIVKSQQLVAVQLYRVQVKQSACGLAVFALLLASAMSMALALRTAAISVSYLVCSVLS